jgi:AhpC/TSA family
MRLSDYAGHNVLVDFTGASGDRTAWASSAILRSTIQSLRSWMFISWLSAWTPPARGKWVKEKLKAPFPILSDSKRLAMEHYGARSPEYRNRGGIIVNSPTLVLVDKTGTIRWIHQDEDCHVRETVEKDLAQARKLK